MFDLNFPTLDITIPYPMSEEEMNNKFFNNVWDKENRSQREFIRKVQIENDKYWVWLYKALPDKPKKNM